MAACIELKLQLVSDSWSFVARGHQRFTPTRGLSSKHSPWMYFKSCNVTSPRSASCHNNCFSWLVRCARRAADRLSENCQLTLVASFGSVWGGRSFVVKFSLFFVSVSVTPPLLSPPLPISLLSFFFEVIVTALTTAWLGRFEVWYCAVWSLAITTGPNLFLGNSLFTFN